MTGTLPLLTLADRVRALTSACRETDEDIALAVGYRAWGGAHLKGYGLNYQDPAGKYIGAPPKFTESLDAAMTLVPEGFAIENFLIWPGHPSSIKLLATAKRKFGREQTIQWVHEKEDGVWLAEAATPALALTGVSLRARAALENSHG